MNRIETVCNHYNHIDEHARITRAHGRVEFLTTVRYIERYLKKSMKILDIGAGTGVYSHFFARKGYEVDAVELVEKNIELFKAQITDEETITISQGDAVHLSNIPSDTYDIVLLFGPLYHLFEEEDKRHAISEALRVAKSSGIVFCAYCLADFSIIRQGFQRGKYKELVEKKLLDPITFQTHSNPEDIFELHLKEDIDRLMSNFHVERLHFVATDLFTHYVEREIDAMDDELFEAYLHYHYSICEREDLVGASAHALDIFRKQL